MLNFYLKERNIERQKRMKFYKKLALVSAAALGLVGLSACSNNNNSSSSSSAKIPTKISKKTTVNFWYSLTGTSQSALKKLTKDFERRTLTSPLSCKAKVVTTLTCKQSLCQVYNHQRTCQLLRKLTQVGFTMRLRTTCLLT